MVAAAIAAALALPGAAAAGDVVPGQVIVRYAPGTSTADRAEARDDAGTRAIEGLGMARAQLLKITDGDSVAATVRQLEAQPEVAYAEPNGLLYPAAVPPDDPDFGQQWGLLNFGQAVNGVAGTIGADIDAVPAWNFETGDQSTVVAVMDTGADLTHPDLVNEIWTNPGEIPGNGIDDDGNDYIDDVNGWDFRSGDNDPTDLTGHGTHVSGIIAAQGDNAIGITGVAYRASLMELRVCNTSYSGGCPVADEISAMNYAADNGAQVLNGSLQGGTFFEGMRDAARLHPDTLYVFAAGNGGSDGIGDNNDTSPVYPCAIDQPMDGQPAYSADNVICVAATDQNDARAGFSNYGAGSVDLGAPGVNILSTSSQRTIFSDDFEGGDFGTKWTSTSGTPWQTTSEAPLDTIGAPGNVGISDSPGQDYDANTSYEVESNSVTLPAGYSSCEIDYWRSIELGSGDELEIAVLLDGVRTEWRTIDSSNPGNQTARDAFFALNPDFDPGGQLQVRLTLTSNANVSGDGVHMDNFRLFCHGSPGDAFFDSASPTGYEYLDGTSMATPMVSGAAALLFSNSPPLTAPSLVKAELLNSVDPVSGLSGNTVSGGRLNVYRALIGDFNPASDGGGGGSVPSGNGSAGSSRKPNTYFNRKPGRVVRTEKPRARVVFRFGSSEADSSFLCQLDSVQYRPCLKRFVRHLIPARHVLKVKAVTSNGAEDPSAAVTKFRVKQIG